MNIRKIAEMTGVSVASVSRALNPKLASKVSPELRKRILDTCEKMRYYPNTHTVRMFSKRSNTIALLMPEESIFKEDSTIKGGGMDASLSASIAGAEVAASDNSFHLLLLSVTSKFIKNKDYLKLYRSKLVDGIVIWGWINTESYIKNIFKENIPCVMMQTTAFNVPASSVVAQNHEGTMSLIDYVIKKGHRNIGIISPLSSSSAGRERYLGALKALEQHNIKPSFISKVKGFSKINGYKATKEILEKSPETTCIIASNDFSAIGVIQAANELGLKVPEDLSVTGADGVELHGLLDLTTYISPAYDIGRKSIELLLALIEGKETGTPQIRLPVEFIAGKTVADIKISSKR